MAFRKGSFEQLFMDFHLGKGEYSYRSINLNSKKMKTKIDSPEGQELATDIFGRLEELRNANEFDLLTLDDFSIEYNRFVNSYSYLIRQYAEEGASVIVLQSNSYDPEKRKDDYGFHFAGADENTNSNLSDQGFEIFAFDIEFLLDQLQYYMDGGEIEGKNEDDERMGPMEDHLEDMQRYDDLNDR